MIPTSGFCSSTAYACFICERSNPTVLDCEARTAIKQAYAAQPRPPKGGRNEMKQENRLRVFLIHFVCAHSAGRGGAEVGTARRSHAKVRLKRCARVIAGTPERADSPPPAFGKRTVWRYPENFYPPFVKRSHLPSFYLLQNGRICAIIAT